MAEHQGPGEVAATTGGPPTSPPATPVFAQPVLIVVLASLAMLLLPWITSSISLDPGLDEDGARASVASPPERSHSAVPADEVDPAHRALHELGVTCRQPGHADRPVAAQGGVPVLSALTQRPPDGRSRTVVEDGSALPPAPGGV